jgi:hypothetical protein
MSKRKHRVKGTKTRNYEAAREESAREESAVGPYEDTDRLVSTRELQRLRDRDHSLAAELDAVEAELREFCREAGHPVEVEADDTEGVRLWHFTAAPETVPEAGRINGAGDLLCEIAYIRERLAAGPPSGDLLGRVYRLGQLVERWRLKPYGRGAAAWIRQSVTAEEQHRIAYGTKDERRTAAAALAAEVEAEADEHPDLKRNAIRDNVGKRHGVSGEAIKKRLQRGKALLGT